MTPLPSKQELVEMFISKDLFSFVMKRGLIKKGDSVNYAQLLDLGEGDLQTWFQKNGYPGLKDSPRGSEWEYTWKLSEGVYEVLFIERNHESMEFSTTSKEEFETWWKDHTLRKYTAKLNYTWVL
jgi:hypothetical protein